MTEFERYVRDERRRRIFLAIFTWAILTIGVILAVTILLGVIAVIIAILG